jgi:hypothetical protein
MYERIILIVPAATADGLFSLSMIQVCCCLMLEGI